MSGSTWSAHRNFMSMTILLCGVVWVSTPASAQQVSGIPGSPGATTTIDSIYLPPPPHGFTGRMFAAIDWVPTLVDIGGGPKGDGLKQQIEARSVSGKPVRSAGHRQNPP